MTPEPTSSADRHPKRAPVIAFADPDASGTPPASGLPHLVIERVMPAVDRGRFPAKRIVGDEVIVQATVYKAGHDLLMGRVRYRAPGSDGWLTAPMRYEKDFDRLVGSFVAARFGRWTFTVDAWTDRWRSWVFEIEKFLAARVDVAMELLEGALLLDEAAVRASASERTALRHAASRLRDESLADADRANAALHPGIAELMSVRLPARDAVRHGRVYTIDVDREIAGTAAWYEMFPRSQTTDPARHGTFADAAARLPAIADLGFDVVYLPPVHPIGTTHRKGRNNSLEPAPDDPGSPWAIGGEDGGHTALHPQLGTLDDFRGFVQSAENAGLEVALDYALQCSPDHPWVREHPDWFFIRPDGSIRYAENPPKKYEDIYPINFWCDDYPALWAACRDVFLFWIEQGVKIFRVDNPHTKPFAFWDWVLGEVKARHPDTIFLAEAFTRPARMHGLAKLGFTQSYTYFTWRNTVGELQEYLTELTNPEVVEYFRPNFFANTPDILHAYLQHGGRPAFRVRLLLAATLSPLYGIYSGFELCENVPVREGSEEYLHSEKYEIRVRDWDAAGNINHDIKLVNRLRREHAALRQLPNLRFCRTENAKVLCYHKWSGSDHVLCVVNLDAHQPQEAMVYVPLDTIGRAEDEWYDVEDLLTGERYTWRGTRNYVRLDPERHVAHVLRLDVRKVDDE
jgi:starch synthase (maltosyl-transferring)